MVETIDSVRQIDEDHFRGNCEVQNGDSEVLCMWYSVVRLLRWSVVDNGYAVIQSAYALSHLCHVMCPLHATTPSLPNYPHDPSHSTVLHFQNTGPHSHCATTIICKLQLINPIQQCATATLLNNVKLYSTLLHNSTLLTLLNTRAAQIYSLIQHLATLQHSGKYNT